MHFLEMRRQRWVWVQRTRMREDEGMHSLQTRTKGGMSTANTDERGRKQDVGRKEHFNNFHFGNSTRSHGVGVPTDLWTICFDHDCYLLFTDLYHNDTTHVANTKKMATNTTTGSMVMTVPMTKREATANPRPPNPVLFQSLQRRTT